MFDVFFQQQPKIRVGIAEDDPTTMRLLLSMCAGWGLTVCGIATNHHDAIAVLLEHFPDVAILDYRLKDGDIFDLLPVCRDAEIPFLVMSAFFSPVILANILPFRPGALLPKPFSPQQFGMAVAVTLAKSFPFTADVQSVATSAWRMPY